MVSFQDWRLNRTLNTDRPGQATLSGPGARRDHLAVGVFRSGERYPSAELSKADSFFAQATEMCVQYSASEVSHVGKLCENYFRNDRKVWRIEFVRSLSWHYSLF